MLEARSVHPGRSAYNHLLALAQSNGIARRRVDEVLDAVGLTSRRARTLSETLERGNSHNVASSDRVVAPCDLSASSRALYSPRGALASLG